MQGFAKRYFILHNSGLLEYSFEPGKPIRDELFIPTAAISTVTGHRDIHIDGDNAIFHVKCMTTDDFDKWMKAFRTFVATGGEHAHSNKSSTAHSTPRLHGQVNKALQDLESAINEAEEALNSIPNEEPKKRSHLGLKEGLKEGGSRLHLFKKVGGRHREEPPESSHSSRSSEYTVSSSTVSSHHRLQAALDSIKLQHCILKQSLANVPLVNVDRGEVLLERHGSISSRHSRRTSTASGLDVWFDAPEPDGALEYVMEDTSPSPSRVLGESDVSQEPETIEEEEGEDTGDDDDSDQITVARPSTSEVPSQPESTSKEEQPKAVTRRTHLPSGPVADEGSLFTVLKKNVGKDLSQVAMPVSFNEPLTMLQRAAEELEYFDLLEKAAQTEDAVERMCYVAAFAVSGYACTKNRSGRKSFNPMLGETFEDARTHFIAEKVQHQPLVMAYHAHGQGWELGGTSSGKTKFWGKSLEIIPVGAIRVKIHDEEYEWRKPSSFMRNLMMGTKYLEHCGEMTIENKTTKMRCVVNFKEAGYWSSPNIVEGTVYSSKGQPQSALEGKWDEQIAQKLDDSHLHVLWRIMPFPKHSREYYGFTSFAITLNEITPDLEGKLPHTDSRYRPDVRALEEGDLDRAELEKVRVEEAQRERRRAGKDAEPRWFRQVESDDWEYIGGYWEEREQGWKRDEALW